MIVPLHSINSRTFFCFVFFSCKTQKEDDGEKKIFKDMLNSQNTSSTATFVPMAKIHLQGQFEHKKGATFT